jgi:hypothetical protein
MLEFFNTPLGIFLAGVAPAGLVALVFCWLNARDTRRLLRRWERKDQLRVLEAQISEETLPAAEQEWRRQFRTQQAAVKRETRHRLGLPEEESDG